MSAARARAMRASSASADSGLALGSSLRRSSSTSTEIRFSSAPIWVLGSGGADGPAGTSAQAESASAARKRSAMRLMSGGEYLEQPGRAHAAADTHGDHAP